MKKSTILLLLVFNSLNIIAQRQDINALPAVDQQNLACNIKELLDNYHEDLVHRHTSNFIHITPNFLAWHKYYIHKMEMYLHSNFNPSSNESSPLPYWNPLNIIPDPFFNTGIGGIAECDRANDIYSPPAEPQHAGIWQPLQTQNISNDLTNLFYPPGPGGISARDFFFDVNTNNRFLCNKSNRDFLSDYIMPHHGSVHTSVGGCFGADFHSAPTATLFSIWHSYVDKIWHDWEIYCLGQTDSDLYIADRESDDDLTLTSHDGIDLGYEPNEANLSYPLWVSDDIWIRNNPDGIEYQEHENPEYQTAKKVYVYVRVRNRGGSISSGLEQLNLYWANPSTSLDYPMAWDGTNTVCSKPSGGQIGLPQTIKPLRPDGYKIYVFEFDLPNPNDYSCIGFLKNHFCLLARITDATKPNEGMTFLETNNLNSNVKNNNNIAWKNITILDDLPNLKMLTGNILVKYSNLCQNGDCIYKIIYNSTFVNPKSNEETNFLKFSKIRLKLNKELYNAFLESRTEIKGGKIDKNGILRIKSNRVEIPVLLKKDVDVYSLEVNATKPKKLPKHLKELKFDIIQTVNENKIVGGERFIYLIKKYLPLSIKK